MAPAVSEASPVAKVTGGSSGEGDAVVLCAAPGQK